MATEKVKVVKLDTQPAQTSVKDLRTQLKALKDTMLSCEQGTEEYNNALRQAADIQHALKVQMEEVNASAMDFGQITSNCTKAIGGMGGGLQAAKAAMNLFGIENEEVIKSLQTMQNLMALTQALPAIDNGVKAFKRLAIAIKASSTAMQGLSKAFVATGLGAIAVALGLLAKRFSKLKEKQDEYVKKQKEYISIQKEKAIAAQKEYNTALEREYSLKEKILGIRFDGNDVKTYTAVLAMYNTELAKVNERLKDRYNDKAMLDAKKRYRELNDELKGLTEGSQEYMNKLLELATVENEIKNIKPLSDEEVKQLTDRQTELNGKVQEYTDKLKEAKAIAGETAAADAREEEKKNLEELAKRYKNLSDYLKAVGLTEFQKKIEAVNKEFQENLDILKKAQESGKISQEQYEKDSLSLFNDYSKNAHKTYTDELKLYSTSLFTYIDNAAKSYNDVIMHTSQEMLENGDINMKEYIKRIDSTEADIQRLATGLVVYQQALDAYRKDTESYLADMQTFYDQNSEALTQKFKDGLITEEEYMQSQALLYEEHWKAIAAVENGEAELITEMEAVIHEKLMAEQRQIEEQTEALHVYVDEISNAMDSIMATADGLSSHWTNAFNTLSHGLVDMGKALRNGSADWTTYGQMAVAALQAAGSVMMALADQQDTTTEEGFEQQKQYQVAATTMNILGGIASAWVSAMNPANSWMTIWGQIAMGMATSAMIMATGIMQIQKIQEQQFEGGSSLSSSSPSAGAVSSIIAPVQYTQDVQGASIEDAIQDTRVYVTETDISNTQRRVSVTENEARY